MARQNYRTIKVKGHYNTYTVGSYPGPYKQIKKWIPAGTRKIKKLTMITQKANVKNRIPYQRTMIKEIPQNLIDSIKTLVKDADHEYSIDIDFERHLETPEQMLVMKGGKRNTIKMGDFELFGHSHPNQKYPSPSNTDLKNMAPLRPEFIVAQTGKAIIINIENYDVWKKYSESDKNVQTTLDETQYDRDRLFERTGVRAYPFVKGLKIEIVDDPIREKHFPRASSHYLAKWDSEDNKK